jgi:release factor glutamine methyltransferase
MTLLLDEIALATARLAEAGVDSPRADAEIIAAHVHNVKRGELYTVPDSEFDARYWVDIGRRENREPLQHITGRAYFRYLELDVGSGVFVPRPETEVMTGWAIDRLREMDVAEPVAVDLGTGSGAIALSIAQEVPRASVHAVEGDPLARGWAERNITRYVDSYTAGRVLLHAGDFVSADPRQGLRELAPLAGTVDLVVTNPPYIPLGSLVAPEVGEYDPPAALWSGADGLDAIRAVERAGRWLLRPGGLIAVEHGAPQGAAVFWVFTEEAGWRDTANHKDLARRDRFVTAMWPGTVLARGVRSAGTARDAVVLHRMELMSARYDCADTQQREDGLVAAATAVQEGQVVVLPTDTVYGIGADAFSPAAVAALLAAKGRGRNLPPPVLVGSVRAASALTQSLGPYGQDLIDEFWPGPLTLVFRASPTLRWDLGDTQGTVAVRMPLHPIALDLLRRTGPMAVSSANLHGAPAATTADEAAGQLGEAVSVYLDGGPCADSVPSTILDLTGTVPRLLRAGVIGIDALRKVVPVIDLPANAEAVAEELSPADRRAAESIAAAKTADESQPTDPGPGA